MNRNTQDFDTSGLQELGADEARRIHGGGGFFYEFGEAIGYAAGELVEAAGEIVEAAGDANIPTNPTAPDG
jgi:hypothetical protein